MLNRNHYWHCAYVISKGTADVVKQAGLDGFRNSVAEISLFLRDRLHKIESWDKVKLLTAEVDRLRRWVSARGHLHRGRGARHVHDRRGVGKDAVAAANILAEPLRRGTVTIDRLKQVRQRREFPTRVTQHLQIFMQNNLIGPALAHAAEGNHCS